MVEQNDAIIPPLINQVEDRGMRRPTSAFGLVLGLYIFKRTPFRHIHIYIYNGELCVWGKHCRSNMCYHYV